MMRRTIARHRLKRENGAGRSLSDWIAISDSTGSLDDLAKPTQSLYLAGMMYIFSEVGGKLSPCTWQV